MDKLDEHIGAIAVSDPELNKLFKEVLDGIRDDISEAQENVALYHSAVLDETGGKDIYGNAYNEALKIKGSARARQLSFLQSFKDRVAVKEKVQMLNEAKKEAAAVTGGTSFNHSAMNKFIEEYESNKNIVQPTIGDNDNDDDDEDDE